MTRTVADAALMLAVMAGPDDRDRTSLEAAPADYVGQLEARSEGAPRRVQPRHGRPAGRRGGGRRRRGAARGSSSRSARSSRR